MLLKRLYWGHYKKVIKVLVALHCGQSVLVILCMDYVQMLKRFFVWKFSDLEHILVEGDLLNKPMNTIHMLSAHELPRSVQLYHFLAPVTFWGLETKNIGTYNNHIFKFNS